MIDEYKKQKKVKHVKPNTRVILSITISDTDNEFHIGYYKSGMLRAIEEKFNIILYNPDEYYRQFEYCQMHK